MKKKAKKRKKKSRKEKRRTRTRTRTGMTMKIETQGGAACGSSKGSDAQYTFQSPHRKDPTSPQYGILSK